MKVRGSLWVCVSVFNLAAEKLKLSVSAPSSARYPASCAAAAVRRLPRPSPHGWRSAGSRATSTSSSQSSSTAPTTSVSQSWPSCVSLEYTLFSPTVVGNPILKGNQTHFFRLLHYDIFFQATEEVPRHIQPTFFRSNNSVRFLQQFVNLPRNCGQ